MYLSLGRFVCLYNALCTQGFFYIIVIDVFQLYIHFCSYTLSNGSFYIGYTYPAFKQVSYMVGKQYACSPVEYSHIVLFT